MTVVLVSFFGSAILLGMAAIAGGSISVVEGSLYTLYNTCTGLPETRVVAKSMLDAFHLLQDELGNSFWETEDGWVIHDTRHDVVLFLPIGKESTNV